MMGLRICRHERNISSLSIVCISEGWSVGVNEEQFYDFLPLTSPPDTLELAGRAHVYFAGVLDQGSELTELLKLRLQCPGVHYPGLLPIATNVTYACPQGMVFSEDWFSVPIITITCLEDGVFETPDWEKYACITRQYLLSTNILTSKILHLFFILATTTECYDCTSKCHL